MACDSSKTCVNKRYSYNACEFMDNLLWEMSGFLFQIKCRDSNAQKKVLKKVLQNLLQFVVRSLSRGAETILTLDKVCSGNDESRG